MRGAAARNRTRKQVTIVPGLRAKHLALPALGLHAREKRRQHGPRVDRFAQGAQCNAWKEAHEGCRSGAGDGGRF